MSKILALNVIVGPNDIGDLKRMLSTCNARETFDEVIIVGTFGESEELKTLCEDNRAQLHYHPWTSERYPHGNFALARNAALDKTEAKYVMWLDCDDIPPTPDEIVELKEIITKEPRDFYLMPYLINRDENGNYTMVFKRERVFRNAPGVRWEFPVHEQINVSRFSSFGDIENCGIKHGSDKDPLVGIKRNILIQEHELKTSDSVHVRFNYAKDLLFLCNYEYDAATQDKAVVMLEAIVIRQELSRDNLAMVCSFIAQAYAYKVTEGEERKSLQAAGKRQAELYAFLCSSFGDHMAEPYVILGDYALLQGNYARGAYLYRKAMTKKPSGVSVTNLSFYESIPAQRLSKVHKEQGAFEEALYYNRIARRHEPKSDDLLNDRREMLKSLQEELCQTP